MAAQLIDHRLSESPHNEKTCPGAKDDVFVFVCSSHAKARGKGFCGVEGCLVWLRAPRLAKGRWGKELEVVPHWRCFHL